MHKENSLRWPTPHRQHRQTNKTTAKFIGVGKQCRGCCIMRVWNNISDSKRTYKMDQNKRRQWRSRGRTTMNYMNWSINKNRYILKISLQLLKTQLIPTSSMLLDFLGVLFVKADVLIVAKATLTLIAWCLFINITIAIEFFSRSLNITQKVY